MKTLLANLTLTIILTSFLQLKASEKDTIGLTDLLAREPGLNGSGLRIALIEAFNGAGRYQPNPASAAQPSSKFSFFDADNPYPSSGLYLDSKRSNHANNVAANYFDLVSGVATDVNEIYVFHANVFYNQIITPISVSEEILDSTDIGAKVINQSFVFDSQNDTADRQYDSYTNDFQSLFVNGVGNGTNSSITSPASSYNGIEVGREDLAHSPNPSDGRSIPQIIAPGSFTSYAAPYVAGSATILIEAALPTLEHGGSGTATEASDTRTIKALLLNGAVKDFSWSKTETHPLDTRKGAGVLNINHSHIQLQGGKHTPTASFNSNSSDPPPTPDSDEQGEVSSLIGWNFSTITTPITPSTGPLNLRIDQDRIDNYYFNAPNGIDLKYDLTATLVWNSQTTATTNRINNLDLILYNLDTNLVIQQSLSTVDNLEHLYERELPGGRYVIQVIKNKTNEISVSEDYALAFNFTISAPEAPSSLTASSQPHLEIDLNWTDNSSDELNFELQRSTLAARAYTTIATLPENTTNYTDTAPLEDTLYYYRVKATNPNGDSFYTNIASARTLTAISSWRQDNFDSSENSGESANSADPDHDGLNNLTEYAIGTDPTSAAGSNGGSATPKASIIEVNGSSYLQITVTRIETKPDLTYTIQVTDDLNNPWAEITDPANILEDSPTTLQVRDSVAISDSLRRFIRLKVTEN